MRGEDAIVSEGVGEENPDSLGALIQRKSDQQASSSNGGGLARMDSLGKLS